MRKFIKSNVLKTAAFLFAASFAFGMGAAVSASANETSPLDSFTLASGASVRYGAEDGKNGIRYTISIAKADYQSLADKGYTDVSFGVLIAPEHYNDIYALNEENVFGANAKYCWDGEQAGKAEIFNLSGSLVEDPLDESKMTFYGAVVDILDGDPVGEANNIALDFRGVGYVKYTYNNVVGYKFVGDENNVRSMAYVAQETIAIDGIDQTMAAALQAEYLNKVDWKLKAENAGEETINPIETATITVPTSVKALDNTFYADKYDVAWTFAGSAVEAGQTITTPKLSGKYTLTATATRKTNAEDSQVVYTKTYVVGVPLLNGTPSTYTYGAYTYDVNTGLYATSVSNTAQYLVDTVTDGDYVVEATITGLAKSGFGYMPGIAINAGRAERIAFKSLSGSNNLWINVADSDGKVSECYVTNFGAGIGGVGATMGIKVARVNNVFYVYNKAGNFVFAMDSTGIYPNGTSQVGFDNSNYNTSTMATKLGQFFANGNENIVGTFTNPYSGTAEYSYDIKMTKGTSAAASYAIGSAYVNGVKNTAAGTFIYNQDKKQFGVDSTRSDYANSRVNFLNTITNGDYTVDLNVNIEYREAGKFGHMIGLTIANGVYSRITLSYAPWEANKLVVNVRDEGNSAKEITVTGFAFTAATGGCYSLSVARLNNVYYVYNSNGVLGFTISASGLTLQSGFTANTSDFTAINEKIANVYNLGAMNVLGIQDTKNAATGTYWFDFTMTRGTTAANNKVNPTA